MCLVLTSDVRSLSHPLLRNRVSGFWVSPLQIDLWGQPPRPGQQRKSPFGQCRGTTWNTPVHMNLGLGIHVRTHSLPAAVTSYKLCLAASPHQSSCLGKFTNLLKVNWRVGCCSMPPYGRTAGRSSNRDHGENSRGSAPRSGSGPASFTPLHASSLSVPISVLCLSSTDLA